MRIFHFTPSLPSGNFGDDAIGLSVVQEFHRVFGEVEWVRYPLRQHTTAELMRTVNSCDLCMVGPGGTFLPLERSISGHQWPISVTHLNKIQVPLVVFASGLNTFPGQKLSDQSWDHLRAVRSVASLFFVRDPWSMREFEKQEIDTRLNPCPTLFFETAERKVGEGLAPMVGINLAGDRREYRFQDPKVFERGIKRVIADLQEDGCSVWLVNHSWSPKRNCADMVDGCAGVNVRNIETNWLGDRTLLERVRAFKDFDVMIGMRGHGVMIPWGQGVPTIGLSTHDKVRSFFDMIDMLGICVLAEDDFVGEVLDLARTVIKNRGLFTQSMGEKRLHLRGLFDDNMELIRDLFPESGGASFPCRDGG